MDILLITSDNLLRDQIKVGLQQFPEFRVTCGESYPGVNMLHSAQFDYIFLELGATQNDCLTLLKHLRSFDQSTEAIALADSRTVKDMAREKQRYGINAFLHNPLNPREFFKLVVRLRDRHNESMAPEMQPDPAQVY